MKKRIFISFAVEDKVLRDFLVGQAKNDNSPFEFYDMSVKTPWDHAWKTNCRSKIKGCDGVIAIITSNTKNASGEIWEINCAKDENVVFTLNGTMSLNIAIKSPTEHAEVLGNFLLFFTNSYNFSEFISTPSL